MVCRVLYENPDGTKLWKACYAHPPNYRGLLRQSANVVLEDGMWPPEVQFATAFFGRHKRWPDYDDVVTHKEAKL